jgi:NitT/TauT family transport system ATP-binding protein
MNALSMPTSRDEGVRLTGVTYCYANGLMALDNISLTIPRGSRVGIIGPSGCGKTTLLRLLADLTVPTAGSIEWPAIEDNGHARAMVFQSDTLLPWLTAAENVAIAFRLRGERSRVYAGRVRELMEMVGLEAFAHAYPYELSGGMRRRIALLSAVAPRPMTLLLDEPFASLDEPTRVSIHMDVLRIIEEYQMTFVLITHDLAEAISLCDEIVLLSARPGRIVSRHRVPFGRIRDVYGLRHDPAFLELYGTLWDALSAQIGPSRAPGA